MGAEHVGVLGVEDRRLDRGPEDRVGMVDEVGVERVVGGDEHGQRLGTGPPGPSGLLPHRGPRAGPAREQDGVQAGDVDPELEGGRGRQAEQPARPQRGLQLATLLGQVPAAVCGDGVTQCHVQLPQMAAGGGRDDLDAGSGAGERDRLHALGDEVGQQVRGLGDRAPPARRARSRSGAASRRQRGGSGTVSGGASGGVSVRRSAAGSARERFGTPSSIRSRRAARGRR